MSDGLRDNRPPFDELPLAVRPMTRVMQIIIGAMFIGTIAFLAVMIVLRQTKPMQAPAAQPVVTFLAVGFATVVLTLSWIIPRIVAANMLRSIAAGTFQLPIYRNTPRGQISRLENLGDAAPFCAVYQTRMIVAAALRESAAFFTGLAYLLEGNLVSLVVAALAVGTLLSLLPTPNRVAEFIIASERQIAEDRLLGR